MSTPDLPLFAAMGVPDSQRPVYFFHIANDRDRTAAEIVFSANQRCDQEKFNAQLKGGVRALTAPLDRLESNWDWIVITAVAWNPARLRKEKTPPAKPASGACLSKTS